MPFHSLPRSPAAGLKHFFASPYSASSITVRGIGVRESMPPGAIERPIGTGDYLIMLFHDPAFITTCPSEEKLLPPETLMIWTPGKGQYYGNRNSPFRHSWIHCEGKKIARILSLAQFPILHPRTIPVTTILEQSLMAIHTELISYVEPDLVIVGNLLENALRELARETSPQSDSGRIPEKLLKVRRMIEESPATPLTLNEMAALAGMSAPYFCARFKQCFGMPPMESLIYHRMQEALRLLGDRNLNISEIGERSGYGDLFHFSKTFKKHFGSSPRDMRNRMRV